MDRLVHARVVAAWEVEYVELWKTKNGGVFALFGLVVLELRRI
jgi:hypothetical protein